MGSMLTEWLNQTEQNKVLLVEEELILASTEQIWELLERKGLTKADLAERMGKSRAFVSQILSGTRNMTLRTLADVAFALGESVTVKIGSGVKTESLIHWEKGELAPMTNVIKFPTNFDANASNSSWYSPKLKAV